MHAELRLSDPAAGAVLRGQVLAGLRPPPDVTVSQFADAEIVLSKGPRKGRWRTDYAPYQRGIMDAFHEPGVQIVVVMGSSQWGKTASALNVIAYHIAHDPCDILVVQPTVFPMAEDFSKNRLTPIIDASPALSAVVSKKRSKDSSNTTLEKTFAGGSIAISGANSAASLAARPVRLLVLDEPNRYPLELPGEGSPIAIAMERTTAYDSRRRILLLSSPTNEGGAIDTWFLLGDQRRYEVPCPACGAFFAYQWKHVRWVDNDPTTARIHCPACDHGLDDSERVAVLADGAWVPTCPERADRTIVSFHVWSAYSPLTTLRSIVGKFLRARQDQKRGDSLTMQVFGNTTLGEPTKSRQGDDVAAAGFLARREAFDAPVPAGACALTMAVDTQDEWLEALVVGWGPGEECWLVDHQRIDGDTSQPEPWLALDDLLDTTYTHASGTPLSAQFVCVDSAGHRTTTVYDYVAKRGVRRVVAIVGRGGARGITSAPSPRRWGQSQRKIPLYTVGVDAAKALWMSRLKVDTPGPGFVHLPLADWCDDEFLAQLTSERLVTTWHKGLKSETWEKTRARNEALDLAAYNLAALRLLHPDLDGLAARLRPNQAPAQAVSAAVPASKWIRPRQGGWLKGNR